MVHKGLTPRKYKFKANCLYDYTLTGTGSGTSATHTANLLHTWGKAYSAGTYGWSAQLLPIHAGADTVDLFFLYPTAWDGIGTYHSTPAYSKNIAVEMRVEVDNYQLVVNPDCSYTMSFDELRFYYAGSLKLTIAALTESGSAWSASDNFTRLFYEGVIDASIPPPEPSCSISFAAQPSWDQLAPLSITGGYTYENATGSGVYIEDDLAIDSSVQPDQTCACGTSVDWADVGLKSYHVHGQSSWSDIAAKTDLGDSSVPCIPPSGNCYNHNWNIRQVFIYTRGYVNLAATNSGLNVTRRQTSATCAGVALPSTDDTVTSTFTYCTGFAAVNYDLVYWNPCVAFFDDDCTNPMASCDESGTGTLERCSYAGSATVGWTTEPPCTGVSNPRNHQTPYGSFSRVHTDSGNVVFSHSYFSVPLPAWDSQQTITSSGDCSDPVVTEDHREVIYCLYTRPSGLVQASSFDGGETFNSEESVLVGCTRGSVKCRPDGTIIRMGYYAASGTLRATLQYPGDVAASAFFTVKDSSAANLSVEDDTYGLSWAADNSGRLLGSFSILGDGGVSDWFSTDDGATWTRL